MTGGGTNPDVKFKNNYGQHRRLYPGADPMTHVQTASNDAAHIAVSLVFPFIESNDALSSTPANGIKYPLKYGLLQIDIEWPSERAN